MTPNRPGWWRGRGIEGADCDEWACWEVRENPDSNVGWFFYFFGYWYPLSEMQEWGDRVPMPDDEPSMCDGTVRMVRGRGQSDVLLPCTKPIDHEGPCEMTELLFGKAGR